jgi:hypothetical protein
MYAEHDIMIVCTDIMDYILYHCLHITYDIMPQLSDIRSNIMAHITAYILVRAVLEVWLVCLAHSGCFDREICSENNYNSISNRSVELPKLSGVKRVAATAGSFGWPCSSRSSSLPPVVPGSPPLDPHGTIPQTSASA